MESEPAPVVVESGPNEHDVEIAEIQAGAQVETAKIYAAEDDAELRAEVERLRGQVTGMQSVLDRIAPPEPEPEPEPEPAPVVVESPAEPEGTPPPPETGGTKAGKANGGGFWDRYS